MNKITIRVSSLAMMVAQDISKFIEWVWQARDINCFDKDILKYERTIMAVAEDNDGPLLFLPVQPALMLESLAPKPGISPRKEALALWKLGEALEKISVGTGIREQYFLCKDDRVSDICIKHGFTEVTGFRVMKKKVLTGLEEVPQDKQAG